VHDLIAKNYFFLQLTTKSSKEENKKQENHINIRNEMDNKRHDTHHYFEKLIILENKN
jgi:hypothetical protein